MNPRKLLIPAILSISFGLAPAVVAVPVLVPSSMIVPVGGTVFGLPESVLFTGTAQIDVSPAEADAPGSVRRVVIQIDLGQLTGQGVSTGASYTAGGMFTIARVLRPNDTIQATIPFQVRGSGPTDSARTGVLQLNLNFNMSNGVLNTATASVAASTL